MFSSKRKRTRSDTWNDFIESLSSKIDEEFDQVNTIETSPLKIALYFAQISRIPFRILGHLDQDLYTVDVLLHTKLVQGKTKITMDVKYIEQQSCGKKLRFQVADVERFVLQSPKYFMENNLKLKNADAISNVEQLIKDVQSNFPTQMNWGSAPYTIIYHKKHHQLIVRFRFSSPSVQFNVKGENIALFNSWFEYSKKSNTFFLVTIIENCV